MGKWAIGLIAALAFSTSAAIAQTYPNVTPTTAYGASSIIAKSAPAVLYSIAGSASSTPPFIMVFDLNTGVVPADGAVNPLLCFGPFTASSPFSVQFPPGPAIATQSGLIVVTSSTGCTTKTATTTTSTTVIFK